MRRYFVIFSMLALAAGCGGGGEDAVESSATAAEESGPAVKLNVQEPEPLAVPEYSEPASETDWAAKVNNKNREVVEVLNILNPVAAYITAGFEQYGDRFSATLEEEWADTQAQLTSALTLYEECQQRMSAGEEGKQLFLDLEEVWQLLVKTGVAGVRTKSMVDAELGRIAG